MNDVVLQKRSQLCREIVELDIKHGKFVQNVRPAPQFEENKMSKI